jgi:hypothetical protein
MDRIKKARIICNCVFAVCILASLIMTFAVSMAEGAVI